MYGKLERFEAKHTVTFEGEAPKCNLFSEDVLAGRLYFFIYLKSTYPPGKLTNKTRMDSDGEPRFNLHKRERPLVDTIS